MRQLTVNFILMAILTTLVGPASALASGHSGVGGGNNIALEFMQGLTSALKSMPSLNEAQVLAKAQGASIIIVNKPLSVQILGVKQPSIAINDPEMDVIQINEVQWNTIGDIHQKEGIALHEVLSLMGLESSGNYPISAQYVGQFGLMPSQVETIQDPNQLIVCYENSAVTFRESYDMAFELLRFDYRPAHNIDELIKFAEYSCGEVVPSVKPPPGSFNDVVAVHALVTGITDTRNINYPYLLSSNLFEAYKVLRFEHKDGRLTDCSYGGNHQTNSPPQGYDLRREEIHFSSQVELRLVISSRSGEFLHIKASQCSN
jgi:hypothetical protein